MTDFTIDADICRAQTPPARLYTDPAYHEAIRERVFARSWQFVGDDLPLRTPGEVLPVTFGEGILNEPLLLVRGHDDRLRCMSNVCTHRAALVVERGGRMPFLRCPYHGRRWGLDGCFKSMPEFAGVENFPTRDDDLAPVALERWGPLLFASLAPHAPFAEWIAEARARVGFLPLQEFRHAPGRSRDYLVQANWMLYIENYLEGFHIPYIHAALTEALDFGSYRTELHRWSSLQLGVGRGGDTCFALPAGHPDEGTPVAAYYYWLFPNLMLNFYPWGLSINVVKPLAIDRTRVSFISYVWDESKLEQGAGAALDRVEREDEAVVESVQRGLRSRLYGRGRYSPRHEAGTHHFHLLLQAALRGGA